MMCNSGQSGLQATNRPLLARERERPEKLVTQERMGDHGESKEFRFISEEEIKRKYPA